MTELIFKLETVYTSLEEEEMMTDTLKFMKNDMRNQNHCDRMKINNIMPNVRDLENSLETLAQAKFINKTRVVRLIMMLTIQEYCYEWDQ